MTDQFCIVNHNPIPRQVPGRVGFKAFVSRLHATFPGLQITIENETAGENKVVFRFQMAGTHQGEFMGVFATGRQLT